MLGKIADRREVLLIDSAISALIGDSRWALGIEDELPEAVAELLQQGVKLVDAKTRSQDPQRHLVPTNLQ